MYIIFEGCIGSGKTTLAQLFAKEYRGKSLLEETKKHPFIMDFYLKPQDYAFQTEMNFILIHYHQLQKAKQLGWFNGVVISDFLFDKDLLFATLTLGNRKEFKLFKNTFDFIKTRTPTPDLVFYLRAPTRFLYQRIKIRGRDFERNIPFGYLKELNKKYDDFFKSFPENKKIVINSMSIDWTAQTNISREKITTNLFNLMKKKLNYNYFSKIN